MSRAGQQQIEPQRLVANADAAFIGAVIGDRGFLLDPVEARVLKRLFPAEARFVRPYLAGDQVNRDPERLLHRYVIDFGQMTLDEVSRSSPALLRIVEEQVKPHRDGAYRARFGGCWWRFRQRRPALFEALAPLSRCLVTARVSKQRVFAFHPTDPIFAHTLCVFPLDKHTAFAVLQSRVHEAWARFSSASMIGQSSMIGELRYALSEGFDSFPFPQPNPSGTIAALEAIGARLYAARAKYMVDADEGLTRIYDALEHPDCSDVRILQLRELHEQMDAAVLAAYGWSDLDVPPYATSNEADKKALAHFKKEVVDRLLVLNEERAAEEAKRSN